MANIAQLPILGRLAIAERLTYRTVLPVKPSILSNSSLASVTSEQCTTRPLRRPDHALRGNDLHLTRTQCCSKALSRPPKPLRHSIHICNELRPRSGREPPAPESRSNQPPSVAKFGDPRQGAGVVKSRERCFDALTLEHLHLEASHGGSDRGSRAVMCRTNVRHHCYDTSDGDRPI